MTRNYFSFSGEEQIIEIEQDETTKETTLRFHPCERVIETIKINKQDFENNLFNVIKEAYFKDSSV